MTSLFRMVVKGGLAVYSLVPFLFYSLVRVQHEGVKNWQIDRRVPVLKRKK